MARVGILALVVGVLLGAARAEGQPGPSSYIVVYKSGVQVGPKTAALEHGLGFASAFRYRAALGGFAATLDARQLARIEADPDVAFVSKDRTVQAVETLAGGESTPTGTRRIGATTATTAQGAAGVNVAVIDTGIDLNYGSELNAADGTNCVSRSRQPKPAQDDNGHGTHVSGTIAAENTGTGVVGVAPGTKLYAVKVLNSAGSGTWSQVICGIDWVTANAASLNIRVASMSLGGSGSNDGNCGRSNGDALHTAICNSVAAGVSYVVAAGNSNASFSSFVPAAYPEVVTVTAVSDSDGQPGGTGGTNTCYGDADDVRASFSNYASASDAGAVAHTIAAPGECIASTWLGGGYNTISGTSMATPHVSGALALCISAGKCTAGASPATLISTLRTTDAAKGFTGDPNHPISGRYYGYLVWVGGASGPSATAPGAPSLTAATPGDGQVALQWSAPPDGGSQITEYRVYRGESGSGSETLLTSAGTQTSFTDTGVTNGTTYWYEVTAVNDVGESVRSNERSTTPQASSAPGAPTGLDAAPAKGRGVQLSWSPPASDGGSPITGYRIYRSTTPGLTPGPSTLLTTVGGLDYKDTATDRGATYYYRVTAVSAAGEGPPSDEAGSAAK